MSTKRRASLKYLIDEEHYEIVFSHYHNLDNFGHVYWEHHNTFGDDALDARYEALFEQVYQDTDRYLGEFLPYLEVRALHEREALAQL